MKDFNYRGKGLKKGLPDQLEQVGLVTFSTSLAQWTRVETSHLVHFENILGTLSKDVFEQHTSTGSGPYLLACSAGIFYAGESLYPPSLLLWQRNDIRQNHLYKNIDTYQYKFGSIKAYYQGDGLNSGGCSSLKNAFA